MTDQPYGPAIPVLVLPRRCINVFTQRLVQLHSKQHFLWIEYIEYPGTMEYVNELWYIHMPNILEEGTNSLKLQATQVKLTETMLNERQTP